MKEFVITLTLFANLFVFLDGAQKASSDGACIYRSVASYFPAYLLGCEIFKIRWPDPEDDPRHMNPEFIK